MEAEQEIALSSAESEHSGLSHAPGDGVTERDREEGASEFEAESGMFIAKCSRTTAEL
jgi:hypothetical protein